VHRMNGVFTVVCSFFARPCHNCYSIALARMSQCKPSRWPNTARMSLHSRMTTQLRIWL
jgi:hypothetical protein